MFQPKRFIIQHAKVLTSQGFLGDVSVFVQDGKIQTTSTTAHLPVPPDVWRFDASGLILSPGWIDLQFNGGFGRDFTADPESVWEVGAQLPRFGTTAFLPTIISSPLDKIDRAIKVMKQGLPPEFSV